jgi:DNA repair protein RecO (recombination protein O)
VTPPARSGLSGSKYLHTEGVCLRRLAYSNTSQVACFLTRESGRLSFLAKGATRAPRRGVRTGIDLLGRYELVYTQRDPSSLQNLTYCWLREGFRRIRQALPAVVCGYYAAELVLNFTAESDPCPRVYGAMVETLRRLAEGHRLGLAVLQFEVAVLREHGTLPVFDRCCSCRRDLPSTGIVVFSPDDGGVVCRRCEGGASRPYGVPVRAALVRNLACLVDGRDPEEFSPRTTVAMSAVVRSHMRHQIGKELRMWKYLQRRELTRSLRRARRHAGIR